MGSPILRTRFMWSCFRGMRFSRRPTRLAEYIGIRPEVVVLFGQYGLNGYGYESNKPDWTNKSVLYHALNPSSRERTPPRNTRRGASSTALLIIVMTIVFASRSRAPAVQATDWRGQSSPSAIAKMHLPSGIGPPASVVNLFHRGIQDLPLVSVLLSPLLYFPQKLLSQFNVCRPIASCRSWCQIRVALIGFYLYDKIPDIAPLEKRLHYDLAPMSAVCLCHTPPMYSVTVSLYSLLAL
jgi:hypothetical protein